MNVRVMMWAMQQKSVKLLPNQKQDIQTASVGMARNRTEIMNTGDSDAVVCENDQSAMEGNMLMELQKSEEC